MGPTLQPAGRAASSGGLSGRLPGHPHCPAPHALAQTQTWEENGAIDFPRQRFRVPLKAFTRAFKSHSTSTKEQITHRPGCSKSLSLQTLVGRAGRAGGCSEEFLGLKLELLEAPCPAESSPSHRPTRLPGQEGSWGDRPREVPRDGQRSSQEPCCPTQQHPGGDHTRVQSPLQRGRCALSPGHPSTVLPVGSSRASRSPPSALCPGAPSLPQGDCRGQNNPLLGPLGSQSPPPLLPSGATAHPNSCSPGSQRRMDPQRPGPSWVTHTHSRTAGSPAECQPPDSGRAGTPHTAESQAGSPWADRKSTRLNSSHTLASRMPSSA